MSEIAAGPAAQGVPRYYQQLDFLNADQNRAVLEWALGNQEKFVPSLVFGGVLDQARRASSSLKDLGSVAATMRLAFGERLPVMVAATGIRPFTLESIELELVAYGDGAHFEAHRDIPIGEHRAADQAGARKSDRILSAVYYFYQEPKRFTGGELRLHRFGSDGAPGDYVDLVPAQNSLVAFPSWVTHQVLPVRCPTNRFEHHRFAVNCWLRRRAS